ncbi:MAG: aminoglycoside phosphotransferase [Moraxellaceae bacterium]|nr:MAG: aminoglycoside phosphotransferase [Moraxellaceae bacterium]
MDQRRDQLTQWVRDRLQANVSQTHLPTSLEMVSGDASFRRYFRARFDAADNQSVTVIAVDAPPDKENNHSFVDVAKTLGAFGVRVPEVYAVDFEQGFMLLSDLGDSVLLPMLTEANVAEYYQQALSGLLPIQRSCFEKPLPPYDRSLLMTEMALFSDWLLERHLGLVLTEADRFMLKHAYSYLAGEALAQPQVTVHRDYHSRNLMCLSDGALGVIDFQDAVHGPITYDAVSLLKDCYCKWPAAQVREWALGFYELLKTEPEHAGVIGDIDAEQYMQWFNLMAAQRHLKAAGIFARLCYRDGKQSYLDDVPRTLSYLVEETRGVDTLANLHGFLMDVVVPALINRQPSANEFFQ